MRCCEWSVIALVTLVSMMPLSASSQQQEEEWPPKNDGLAPAFVFGPEAVGFGIGYNWWDLGGKQGRDLSILDVFVADTPSRFYLLKYREPDLLMQNDHLDFTGFYQKRSGMHYFGVGPEAEMEDGAYYQREEYLYKLSYSIPLGSYFRFSGEIAYDRVVPRKSELEDREDFHADYEELDRPLEDAYPQLLQSREFTDEMCHYWALQILFNNVEGPRNFPVKGGYAGAKIYRIDGQLGAEWNYWKYTAIAAWHLPTIDDYNVIAARARWDRLDGKNVPFYKLPSLGQARFPTGFVTDGSGMRGIWENLYADRNRFLGTVEYRHRIKANWFPDIPPEKRPFGIDIKKRLQARTWFIWMDAGNTWPDTEDFEDVKISYGNGHIIYLPNGNVLQITIGQSEDLEKYVLISYGLQF